jgi:hypothetical protein
MINILISTLKRTHLFSLQAAVDIIMRKLKTEGVLVGGPTLPQGLPYPDGDEIVDLLIKDPLKRAKAKEEAETLPKALLTDIGKYKSEI